MPSRAARFKFDLSPSGAIRDGSCHLGHQSERPDWTRPNAAELQPEVQPHGLDRTAGRSGAGRPSSDTWLLPDGSSTSKWRRGTRRHSTPHLSQANRIRIQVTAWFRYGGIVFPIAIGAVVDGLPTTFHTPLSGHRSPVLAVLPTAMGLLPGSRLLRCRTVDDSPANVPDGSTSVD